MPLKLKETNTADQLAMTEELNWGPTRNDANAEREIESTWKERPKFTLPVHMSYHMCHMP